MNHVISGNDIEHLIDHLYFTDNVKLLLLRTFIDMNSGEVKTIKVGENNARKSFRYRLNNNVKFPLGL